MNREKIMVRVCEKCGTIYSEKTKRCESCSSRLGDPIDNQYAPEIRRRVQQQKNEISEIIDDSRRSDVQRLDGSDSMSGNRAGLARRRMGAFFAFGAVACVFFVMMLNSVGSCDTGEYYPKEYGGFIVFAVYGTIMFVSMIAEVLAEKSYNRKASERIMVRICEDCGTVCSVSHEYCDNCSGRLGEPVKNKKHLRVSKAADDASAQENPDKHAEPAFQEIGLSRQRRVAGIFSMLGSQVIMANFLMNYMGVWSLPPLDGKWRVLVYGGSAAAMVIGLITTVRCFRFDSEQIESGKRNPDRFKLLGAVLCCICAAAFTVLSFWPC